MTTDVEPANKDTYLNDPKNMKRNLIVAIKHLNLFQTGNKSFYLTKKLEIFQKIRYSDLVEYVYFLKD